MKTMPRLLLLLFCMSVVTMMFIARCGLNMDSQMSHGHQGALPSAGGTPGERALREVMRRKEVEHIRDKSALQEKIRTLEAKLAKVQGQVVNLTASLLSTKAENSRLTQRQHHPPNAHMGYGGDPNGAIPRGADSARHAKAAGFPQEGRHGINTDGVIRNRNYPDYDVRPGQGDSRAGVQNPVGVGGGMGNYDELQDARIGGVRLGDTAQGVGPAPIGGIYREKTALGEPVLNTEQQFAYVEREKRQPYGVKPAGFAGRGNGFEARQIMPGDMMGNPVNIQYLGDQRFGAVNSRNLGNLNEAGSRNMIDRHALGVVGDTDGVKTAGLVDGMNVEDTRGVAAMGLERVPRSAPVGQEVKKAQSDVGGTGVKQTESDSLNEDKTRAATSGGESKVNETAEFIKYFQEHLKSAEILKGQPYKTEYELIPFNRFIFNRIFMVDPGLGKRVVEKPIGSKKKDLNEIMYHAVESLNKNRSSDNLYTHDDFVEGLYRTDPTSGSHFELFFNDRDSPDPQQKHSYVKISILRPFAPPVTVQHRSVDTTTEWINIILPLSGRVDAFRIFMEQFTSVCVKHDKRVYLTVVYFGVPGLKEVKAIMSHVAKTHKFKLMKLVTLNETFARGRGLQIGALNWKGGDALLFFCDVDIVFTAEFLERCRLNTERGQRVYYPIVFSLYNPRVVYSLQDVPIPSLQDQLVLSKDTGFWRDFGYGMTCQYRSDFLKIKGFDEQITGWGGEDVFLYQKFVRSDYFVIRATDPAIFHLWHEKYCDPTLSAEQYRSCIRSKALNEASHPQLGLLAFKDEVDVHRSVSERNLIAVRAAAAEGKESAAAAANANAQT
ncbi:chondroitin sulfate N-acetylgalactosaminyltransferase 2 [Aplysia californica]|uniref:Hexosyltransferase n=1 Tax=Aplysia californica TaxID=6500 RepID=A0ABM1A1L8_APLCA|nr:chondroitin sulfate N-acetylgalactosaminyltransferase 2 [Aplysia californica]